MKTPAEVYERSPRQLPEKPPEHSYPDRFESRRVRGDGGGGGGGGMKWGGKHLFVGEALAGEMVGLEAIDDGLWHVH